ncbi:MAG: hypothetical protein ACE5JR_13900 [Gemmatimonadota bacterium]
MYSVVTMVSWLRALVAVAALSLAFPLQAGAAEYRLKVASLYEEAFYALLGSAGTRREGPVEGRSPLIHSLDTGKAPAGVLIYDRFEAARGSVATAFGASRVGPGARRAREDAERWSEMRWQGEPGEWSVWAITPSRTRDTEVRDVALKGTGRLVRVIPHLVAFSQPAAKALGMALEFIEAYEGNPALWSRYLSPVLDLGDGVAVVVGVNESSPFADHVFIVVKHAPLPTTYHVVLAWKRRLHEVEADSDRSRTKDP